MNPLELIRSVDLLGLAALLGVGLVVFYLAVGWFVAMKLLHPPRRTYGWAVARNRPGDPSELETPLEYESWNAESRGRRFECWDIEGADPDGPVVVFAHGWSDARLGSLERIPHLAEACSRFVAFDFARHGESDDGRFTLGVHEAEDLDAVLRMLDTDRPVVLYGWSLGGGVALDAAARGTPCAGVIAEAPYARALTPARNVLRIMGLPYHGVPDVLFVVMGVLLGLGPRWKGFDRSEIAAKLRVPVHVIHGSHDEVCPVADGRAIAESAERGSYTEIQSGRHTDLWSEPHLGAVKAAAVNAVRELATIEA